MIIESEQDYCGLFPRKKQHSSPSVWRDILDNRHLVLSPSALLPKQEEPFALCERLCFCSSFPLAWDTAVDGRGRGWPWDAESTKLVDSVSLNYMMLKVPDATGSITSVREEQNSRH